MLCFIFWRPRVASSLPSSQAGELSDWLLGLCHQAHFFLFKCFLSFLSFFKFILNLFRNIQNVNRAAALSFWVCFWRRCCLRFCLFVCFAISRWCLGNRTIFVIQTASETIEEKYWPHTEMSYTRMALFRVKSQFPTPFCTTKVSGYYKYQQNRATIGTRDSVLDVPKRHCTVEKQILHSFIFWYFLKGCEFHGGPDWVCSLS